MVLISFSLGGSVVLAGPGDTGNGTIPPGLTKVTFVHHSAEAPEVIVERGPGNNNGKGFSSGEAAVCSVEGTNGTDLCDSFEWGGQFWPGASVPYSVNLKNSGDDGTFLAAIQASAQTWEDDPGSAFDFTFLGTTGRKASSLRNRMDGNNDVTWSSLNKFQNPIAVTIFWYSTATGEVVETDLINNSNFPWAADGDPGSYDVQNIGTHEFGHFLVLGDLYDPSDSGLTMYGYGAVGETAKVDLGVGDELGIRAIYPSGPPNDAPVVSISSPTDGSTFLSGETISSVGSASDTEDIDLTAGLAWTSSVDGPISTGGTFSAALSDGIHTITASVTDSGGATGSDSVSITVGTVVVADGVTVSSVTYATEGGRNSDKHLLITVALVDDLGNPVGGASVTIELSRNGSLDAGGTGTTGAGGTLTFSRKNARSGTYTTEVMNVTAAGLTWDGATPFNEFVK
jgi:hypothetical protein